MVQTGGFEPPTFSSQTSRSTKLNYACIGGQGWIWTNNTIVTSKRILTRVAEPLSLSGVFFLYVLYPLSYLPIKEIYSFSKNFEGLDWHRVKGLQPIIPPTVRRRYCLTNTIFGCVVTESNCITQAYETCEIPYLPPAICGTLAWTWTKIKAL